MPRAREEALGKGFFKKNKKNYLPTLLRAGPRQRFKKNKKIYLPRVGPRQTNSKKNHFFAEGGPSAKKPPTAPAPDGLFSLPRAVLALGKGFAECPIKGPRKKTPSPSTPSIKGPGKDFFWGSWSQIGSTDVLCRRDIC